MNPDTIVHIEVPVSEPPDKSGWYYVTNSSGELLMHEKYWDGEQWSASHIKS